MDTLFLGRDRKRRLAWHEVGDPSGFAIVHCHGGLSCRLETAFADRICRERGVRWITADRPGIGGSDIQPGRKLTDWADDMAALADHLQLGRFAVSGWSAGGPYALACGAQLGDRVSQVITMAGMAPLRGARDIADLGMATDRFLFRVSPGSPRLAATGLAAARRAPPALVRASVARALSNSPDAGALPQDMADRITAALTESLRLGGLGTALDYALLAGDWGFAPARVKCPVVIWHGSEDRLLPIAHAQRLADWLPAASFRRCEGLGHFLPQRCLAEILDSLF